MKTTKQNPTRGIRIPTRPRHLQARLEPSHYCPQGLPDILDVALVMDIPFQHNMYAVYSLDSDHVPVSLFLGTDQREADTRPTWNSVQTFSAAVRRSIDNATSEPRREYSLPDYIRVKIREKNIARRRWQLTWDSDLRRQDNRLAETVKTAVRNHLN